MRGVLPLLRPGRFCVFQQEIHYFSGSGGHKSPGGEYVSEIQDKLTQNNTAIAKHRDEIYKHNAKINTNTTNIAKNTAGIATNIKNVNNIKNKAMENKNAIDKNKNLVQNHTSFITQNAAGVARNKNDIAEFKELVNKEIVEDILTTDENVKMTFKLAQANSARLNDYKIHRHRTRKGKKHS